MTKNKQAKQPEKEFLDHAFTRLVELVTAAVEAIHVVLQHTIDARFR